MDYMEEIAANNARIAELKAELARLGSTPQPGSDALDYALAANRAEYGDLGGARWHLSNPAERARIERLARLNETTDKETQYATLQDNVVEAEENLALGESSKNTALIKAAQRKLENARTRLAMFERKNPNLTKMHWNWRNTISKETPSLSGQQEQQAPLATVEGGNALLEDLLMTGTDGQVYLKEGSDINPVLDYYKKIPYWYEKPEVRKQIKFLNELKSPTGAAEAPTAKNIGIRKLDEKVFKNGLWNDAETRNKFAEMYEAMSTEDKNSKEGMNIKNALSKWTKDEYAQWLADQDAEARWLMANTLNQSDMDIAEADGKFTSDGWKWELKNGKWREKSGKWRTKDSRRRK